MQIICKNVSLGYDSHVVSENIDFAVARAIICVLWAKTARARAR